MIDWLEKNRKISIIFLVMIAIEIFVFSALPGGGVSAGLSLTWLYHFSIFFLFCFFFLTSIFGKRKITGKRLVFVFVISLIYAILDEAHQFFVPGRSATVSDVLIDLIGIFVSSLIYMRYIANKNKDKKS